MYPDDLKYTREHEWARQEGGRVRVGITAFAQDQLGDVVFVDLYSPVSGTIVERNDELDKSPELINSDPYGQGWLVVVQMTDPDELDQHMEADAYAELVAEA